MTAKSPKTTPKKLTKQAMDNITNKKSTSKVTEHSKKTMEETPVDQEKETTRPDSDITKQETKSTEHGKDKQPVRYQYSMKLSTSASNANIQHSAPKNSKQEAPTNSNNFSKEEAAIKEAESIDEADVEHIKYSAAADKETKGFKESASVSAKDTAQVDGLEVDTASREKQFSLKNLVTKIKKISLTNIGTSAKQAFTKKQIDLSAAKVLGWIDSCISFITTPKAEGRNAALEKARTPILFGMWVCLFTFIIGGLWSGFAPLNSSSHATGIVMSTSKKQIIQQKDGGIVKEIYVKEGEHVKKDQPLMQIDDSHIKSSVEAAHAQREGLEKQLAVMKERVKSYKELEEKGFISRMEFLNAEVALADVQSRLSEAKARESQLEEIIDRAIVKSPVNGVVTQIDIHTLGATVAPGQALMTVTPTEEELIIEAYISSQDIESIHVGLKAKVRIAAFKHRSVKAMDGIVTYISPDTVDVALGASPHGRLSAEYKLLQGQGHLSVYKVIISIDKAQLKEISKYKDYELAPGMAADVAIVTGERTMIQYLLDPITAAFWHAFSEK